jgi:hypothetical protein
VEEADRDHSLIVDDLAQIVGFDAMKSVQVSHFCAGYSKKI